jgi:hypothetical protein
MKSPAGPAGRAVSAGKKTGRIFRLCRWLRFADVRVNRIREAAMSDSSRARLDVQKLDDRTVPSTVSSSSTVRPFDFVGIGTYTTTSVNSSGPVALTSTGTANVTANGQIDFATNNQGSASLVTIAGTGTGSETPVNPADSGGRGSFAETVQGQFSFLDASGAISTPQSLTGTVNWMTPTGSAGTDLIGPQPLTGTFDTSTFKLSAGWNTATSIGNVSVTLASKTNAMTDLAFEGTSASLAQDGSVSLGLTAVVSGNLMHAATHDTAATTVTAVWEGDDGQSEAADLNVAIYWNTGSVAVNASGLTPPEWAKRLVVKLDAGALVSEANENNNTWTVNLSDLVPPPPPPPPPPLPTAASFAILPGEQPILQWLGTSGQVLAQSPAMPDFNGPVQLATGDVNGDGVVDAVIGAGAGGGPRVRVVDGRTGAELQNFFAYDSSFRGGVHVAVGDTDGDGTLELITGAGAGGGPHVKILNAATGETIREFFAFDDSQRDGVAVATGDIDGDGKADVIVTPGSGDNHELFVFSGGGASELFRSDAAESMTGDVTLTAGVDPISHAVVVTLTPEDGPAVKLRSQLADGEPLLVQVDTRPILFADPLAI